MSFTTAKKSIPLIELNIRWGVSAKLDKPTKLVFAIDFDGCIVSNEWPAIGEPKQHMVDFMRRIKELGHTIIIWTCREGESLREALEFLDAHQIPYDYANENCPERIKQFGNDCRKIGADFYIDDRMIGADDTTGLFALLELLSS